MLSRRRWSRKRSISYNDGQRENPWYNNDCNDWQDSERMAGNTVCSATGWPIAISTSATNWKVDGHFERYITTKFLCSNWRYSVWRFLRRRYVESKYTDVGGLSVYQCGDTASATKERHRYAMDLWRWFLSRDIHIGGIRSQVNIVHPSILLVYPIPRRPNFPLTCHIPFQNSGIRGERGGGVDAISRS